MGLRGRLDKYNLLLETNSDCKCHQLVTVNVYSKTNLDTPTLLGASCVILLLWK